jgi:hypothetical protein
MKAKMWLIPLFVGSVLVILIFSSHDLLFGWHPPKNSDLAQIPAQAEADTDAKRYSDALAKYTWLFKNQSIESTNTRAAHPAPWLYDWAALGSAYPPALAKLRSLRDRAERKTHSDKDLELRLDFETFAILNEALHEDSKTSELFRWFDANEPTNAKVLYPSAQVFLIRLKNYQLCGKYIDMSKTFDAILKHYTSVTYPEYGDTKEDLAIKAQIKPLTEQMYKHDSATLVALLTQLNRLGEADWVAKKSVEWLNDTQFKITIQNARKGIFPPES